jgi:hypothetical protein
MSQNAVWATLNTYLLWKLAQCHKFVIPATWGAKA